MRRLGGSTVISVHAPLSRRLACFLGGVVAGGFWFNAAVAEPAGHSVGAIEEVIVTARRRAEDIQDVPVAVTAMSGEALREAGIVNVREFSKTVPSLQIVEGQSNQIFLRGVGQLSGLVRQSPSVSVYLDGVFIPRPDGQLMNTVDVESVQVLRGPQGTLFGKNNTGGAIVLSLMKPEDEFAGHVTGSLGNYNLRRAEAMLNVPVTDSLATRFSVNTHQRDGYLKDPSTPDNASIDRVSAFFQARWLATDNLMVDGLAYYGRIRERSPSYNCRLISNDALFVEGLGILWPGDTDPSNPRAYRENCAANDRRNLRDLQTNLGPGQHQKRHLDDLIVGLTFNWELTPTHNLTTILGHRNAVARGPRTVSDDGGPAKFTRSLVVGEGDQRSTTAELQLTGALFDGRVDYTLGAFFQDEFKTESFLSDTAIVGIDAISLASVVAGRKPDINEIPPGGTNPPIVGALIPPNQLQDFDIDERTLAPFFQGTYHLTERLELTAGARYTEVKTRSRVSTRTTDMAAFNAILGGDLRFTTIAPEQGLHIYNAGTWLDDPVAIANSLFREAGGKHISTPLGPARHDRDEATFREVSAMVSASYVVPEWILPGFVNSLMTYLTWSNGFKSGFLEPSGIDGLTEVKPETLENREIGFKLDAFDRRVRLNVALYSMIFENMQLITVGVDSANTLVVTSTNAGESHIRGGEMEFTWHPLANLAVSLSYSNNSYKFVDFEELDLLEAVLGRERPVDRSDERLPKAPDQTAALGVQYTWNTGIGAITSRLDVSYTDDIYHGFDRGAWEAYREHPERVSADDYVLVDGRLAWRNPAGDLSVALWGKNLTDERFLNGWTATGSSIGTFVEIVGEPRTFGVEVRKLF